MPSLAIALAPTAPTGQPISKWKRCPLQERDPLAGPHATEGPLQRAALVGRWVIFQEGPIPARSSSRAGDTCLMKPRMLHTHPAAIAWVLRCFTCPGRAEPPSHRASLKTTSKETWGERRKLSLMEGETLELFHAAGSTSITRWECCTPGEPFAELSAQGGSGATAENSPAVYFSFRSPVPLPGINA